MRTNYQFKLYRAKKNKHLHHRIEVAAAVYNHLIALHKRYYRIFGKSLNKYRLQNQLPVLKKRFPHWGLVGSQALQDIVFRIDFGYQKFFKKENKHPPTFRKRSKYKSFTLTQAGWKLLGENQIQIGKHTYKFFKSREISAIIKTVTIKRDSLGDLYLFFSCKLPDAPPLPNTQIHTSVGLDFGLKTFLTTSDGNQIESPQCFKKGLNAIKRANRQLSKKKKGSSNRRRARLNLARVHKRVANQRKDYHFKLAKQLAESYDLLCFEDLNINAMKKLWGRKVSDLSFSDFLRIQQHQCAKVGSQVHQIDRFFPSSKKCHACQCINHDLELKDRTWICKCGMFHQRDKNAAINIHNEGATSFGLGSVRPPQRVAASA